MSSYTSRNINRKDFWEENRIHKHKLTSMQFMEDMGGGSGRVVKETVRGRKDVIDQVLVA